MKKVAYITDVYDSRSPSLYPLIIDNPKEMDGGRSALTLWTTEINYTKETGGILSR